MSAAICLAFAPAPTTDLGNGMAVLPNTAMIVAGTLMLVVLFAGPTTYLMGGSRLGDTVPNCNTVDYGPRSGTDLDQIPRNMQPLP